jgi:MFS family permease
MTGTTSGPLPDRRWPRGYRRLLAARVLLRSYFFVPFIVLYARDIGVSLGTLLAVEAFFSALVVIVDVPVGVVADRIGPRQALIVGASAEAAAALLLAFTAHPAVFWSVQPLFALALALTQGADAGLAGALLREGGRPERFELAERILQSSSLGWNAAVFALASLLSLKGFATTFLATAVVQSIAVMLLCTLPDARASFADAADRLTPRTWLRHLRAALRQSRSLRLDLLAMVLTGTAFSVLLYLVPAYLVASGIDEHLTGAATAVISLAAAGVGCLLPGSWNLRITVVLAAAGALLFVLPYAAAALAAGVLVQAGQARLLPRFRAQVMADLGGWGEASAMSVVTTTAGVGFAALAPVLGLLTDTLRPPGLAVLCTVLLLGAGFTMTERLHRGDRPEAAARAEAERMTAEEAA